MLKFKLKDKVKITLGKDKGREGTIEKIYPAKMKVVVPGINMYKKHVKGVGETKGGIYDMPRALSFGKIALICPKCNKMTRIGFKFAGDEKVRFCKKCGKEVDSK